MRNPRMFEYEEYVKQGDFESLKGEYFYGSFPGRFHESGVHLIKSASLPSRGGIFITDNDAEKVLKLASSACSYRDKVNELVCKHSKDELAEKILKHNIEIYGEECIATHLIRYERYELLKSLNLSNAQFLMENRKKRIEETLKKMNE